jgi:hypothetical protein
MTSLLLALSFATGCLGGTGDGPGADGEDVVETIGDPGDDPGPDVGDYDALFDPGVVQEIRLGLSDAAMTALGVQDADWQPATFEHDGNKLDVEVRLTGGANWRDFTDKPAFRLKFKGQTYAGLHHLVLHNLVGDPAQGREVLALWVWNEAGMPAPRASFARVYVNDELYGLYAAIEGVDDTFPARRYTDATGDFWSAGGGDPDLTSSGILDFDLESGSGDGPVALQDAANTLAVWSNDFVTHASTVVNMDQFFDYWAWTDATGGQSGYPYHLDDYFLYADPADSGRLVYVPWNQDETWSETWLAGNGVGVVGWACGQDDACTSQRKEHLATALTTYGTLGIPEEAQALFSLTDAEVQADPRRSWTAADVAAARAALVTRTRDWPTTLRSAMGM